MAARRVETNRNFLRDLQFDTETSAMSYATSGVWSDNTNNVLFNTTDRTSNLFIAGADTGAVRLYRYPCDVETIKYSKRAYGVR